MKSASICLSSSLRHHLLSWKVKACLITAKMSTWGTFHLLKWTFCFFLFSSTLNIFFFVSLHFQFCGRSGPSLEGAFVRAVVMAGLSWLHHRGFQGNGRSTWASRHGGNWETDTENKVYINEGKVSETQKLIMTLHLFTELSFTGGNGAVDGVSHILLGGSNWTEGQEDLWLVGNFSINLIFVVELNNALNRCICFNFSLSQLSHTDLFLPWESCWQREDSSGPWNQNWGYQISKSIS